jgi:hypothetical protein
MSALKNLWKGDSVILAAIRNLALIYMEGRQSTVDKAQ